MTSYQLRLTPEAEDDLVRLYAFIVERDRYDDTVAQRALEAIQHGFKHLELMPFSCRKVEPHNPYLRELLISFGASGYVALLEIEPDNVVTVLALRHQREDDYH
jgi:plasmid stabilization system protein ParE